jgi:hypothetical protein
VFGNRNACESSASHRSALRATIFEACVIDNRFLHGCSYLLCDIVSLSGREGGQVLGQTSCLKEFQQSLFVRERCRLRMGPNLDIGEAASQQATSRCFRRREMPAPCLTEADQERGTNYPLDVALRAALSHQLPPRDEDRSQVGEQPVMVSYPMKRCSGEDCVKRMIVAGSRRSSSSVTRPVPQPASRTSSVPSSSSRGRIAFPQRCWGSAMRS